MAFKRKALRNQRKSARAFSRGARKIHKKNMPRTMPMRGGIRL